MFQGRGQSPKKCKTKDRCMLSIAAYFASGAAFFSGAASLLAGLTVMNCAEHRIAKAAGRIVLLLGIFQIIVSATPLPVWAYSIWTASFLAWGVAGMSRFASRPRRQTAAIAVCMACTIGVAAWELCYQTAPSPPTGRFPRLVVIGDSLSATEFTDGGDPWPALLARDHHLHADNLAFNGAKATSAEKNVTADQVAAAFVLLEIGGNDLLGGTSAADFDRDLERLLKKVCRSDNVVFMLELPLPPLYNRYGEIQRRLASAYGVRLIPKREFAAVIAAPNATIDGLHFSPAGHRTMAALISKYLPP